MTPLLYFAEGSHSFFLSFCIYDLLRSVLRKCAVNAIEQSSYTTITACLCSPYFYGFFWQFLIFNVDLVMPSVKASNTLDNNVFAWVIIHPHLQHTQASANGFVRDAHFHINGDVSCTCHSALITPFLIGGGIKMTHPLCFQSSIICLYFSASFSGSVISPSGFSAASSGGLSFSPS